MKTISVARALSASFNGGSLRSKRERKKSRKAKGVIDRIRHFNPPRIRNSIRVMLTGSKMIPSSLCFKFQKPNHNKQTIVQKRAIFYVKKRTWKSDRENEVFIIFAARERQEIERSFKIHGFPFCNTKSIKSNSKKNKDASLSSETF